MRRGVLITSVFLLAFAVCPRVRGDVGVVLNESLDTSVARITGSGHSAVYLSRICPASPIELRMCGPNEQGSVMSNYTTLGEEQPFEWNIAPLNVYLYGVTDSRNRPLFATGKIKNLLEEQYRRQYLADYCGGPPCTTSKKAEWREMAAADSERSIYIFVVKTTVQQDEELVAKFNALPNKNHFNAFTRNCANFTRDIINTYFPHATRPDYINDFGITSPKAIARSFARYAHRHPEADYHVLHFAQLPGTIKRSTVARDGAEQLYRSKKLLLPMIFFASHELPVVAASYFLTGRFDPEHEFADHPTERATKLEFQLTLASDDQDGMDEVSIESLKRAKSQERADILGSSSEWARYREEFDSIVDRAVREELASDRECLSCIYRELDEKGTPFLDNKGALWMEIDDKGRRTRIGLSAANILAPGSDPGLAYQVILADIEHVFKSPAHSRETMPEFKQLWSLVQARGEQAPPSLAMQPNSKLADFSRRN